MSIQSITNFLEPTPDGEHFDFWSAAFNDLHLYVPERTRIQVNEETAANLPGIAAKFLGSRYYWWVILMYNGLSDPLNDIIPGTVLSIPDSQQFGVFVQNRIASKNAGNFLPTVGVTTL